MNNTIKFQVAGNDVLDFMSRIKKNADELAANMISNAQKQHTSAKDQLKDFDAQIKALEKRNKLQAESNRVSIIAQRDVRNKNAEDKYRADVEAIKEDPTLKRFAKASKLTDARVQYEDALHLSEQTTKEELKALRESVRIETLQEKLLKEIRDSIVRTSDEQVLQIKKGDAELADIISNDELSPKEKLANELTEQQAQEDKKGSNATGFLGQLLNVQNLGSLMTSVGQLGSSENGFDLIHPAAKSSGYLVGTILGGIVGSLIEPGGGTMIGAGIGGSIGSMFGDTIGQFEQRRLISQQEFLGNKNKYEATTRKRLTDISDTSSLGVGVGEYIEVLRQIAVNTATTARATENTNDVIEMGKALGIDQSVTSEMLTRFRGTQKDISNLVGGIMMKGQNSLFQGGDYTFLNEFLQKFNSLRGDILSLSENVSTGNVYSILETFNKVGGQYSSRDVRSSGYINTIHQSLINPSSDALKAMSFLSLRRDNPNMTYSQLMEEQQKGLSSPHYLKSMLNMIDQYGGDKSAKIANLTALTGGNYAAARRLWDNRDKVGTMSQEEIEEMYTGNFKKEAEGKTTIIEQNMAMIKNGLLSTWSDGVEAMVESFSNALKESLNGAVIDIGQNGKITLGQAKVNPTKSGTVLDNMMPFSMGWMATKIALTQ